MADRVVNSAGKPVRFATIQLEGTIRRAETDENGNFVVMARPGTHDVRVIRQGWKKLIEAGRLERGVTKLLDEILQR